MADDLMVDLPEDAGTDYDARPGLQRLRDWKDQLNGEWNGGDGGASLDAAQGEEEAVYFQRFTVNAPYGRLGVKTGSAPSDVDAAVDALVPSGKIEVQVRPLRDREKYRKQADKLRRFALALLDDWRRPKDVVRLLASDMAIRRYGVARVMLDESLWPDMPDEYRVEPEREEDEDDAAYEARYDAWDGARIAWMVQNRGRNPIVFEKRNPRFVRWREYRGRLLVLVESYETTALEAYAAYSRFPRAREILKGLALQRVRVDEVWYERWRAILLNDMPIFDGDGVVEHGYPEIPYVTIPFRELPFEAAVERYRGMLTNSVELYPAESNALTMHLWMLAWNAWRTYVGFTVDGRELKMIPGQYIELDERRGEYLKMLEGQPVPPELVNTAGLFSDYIQRNGVAQGPRTVDGTRSAQQLWAIQNAREKKLDAPRTNLQVAIDKALQLAAQIVERMIADEVTLPVPGRDREGNWMGEVSVGPRDINGYTSGFRVTFVRKLDPAMLEQNKVLMGFAVNNYIPLEVAWELGGLTDFPQEWADLLMDQSVERLPFMMELLGLKRAEQYFGKESEEYQLLLLKIQEAKQQQQQVPGPGVPARGAITPSGSSRGPGGIGAGMPAPGAGGRQPVTPRGGGGGGSMRNMGQSPPKPGGF